MLATLSIRALSIIVVVLNSNLIIPGSMPCVVVMNALSLQVVFFFFFGMPWHYFWISRHDVLDKKNCGKQAFGNLVVGCRGRKEFFSTMIRSHFFGEPMTLNCELHKHFSAFSPSLGWLEWAGLDISFCRAIQFSSVTQPCPTLCDPMNRSTPGLPFHHQLPEFTQTHAHRVGDAIQPSHPLSSPSPPAPNHPQHQGLFQWINSSHEVAKVLEFQLQHQSFQWTPRTHRL